MIKLISCGVLCFLGFTIATIYLALDILVLLYFHFDHNIPDKMSFPGVPDWLYVTFGAVGGTVLHMLLSLAVIILCIKGIIQFNSRNGNDKLLISFVIFATVLLKVLLVFIVIIVFQFFLLHRPG